jgi:two-component system, NtrC family, sensor histidine kinase PilS
MLTHKLHHHFIDYFSTHEITPLQSRARDIINLFRALLSFIFVSFYLYISPNYWWDTGSAVLFFRLSIAYLCLSSLLLVLNAIRPRLFKTLHPLITITDIIFILFLMYAAGGMQSSLGLLLIITIVGASIITNGRLAFFYAAIATLGLLFEQSYQILKWNLEISFITQPAMLSLSCFATAWLAHTLAKRIHHSEALANARGIDLENLSQVNALITQEMQEGVIVVDHNFYIRHYNLQASLLLALPSEQHVDMSLMQIAPEISQLLNDWLKGHIPSRDNIVYVDNRELKLNLMPFNQLRNSGAVIFIEDFSKAQTINQQAKLAALGRLTANIAHEIRNPLSAISHATQLLQEDALTTEHHRMLEIVSENIARIDQIVKDVLELNRRDRTQQESIHLATFIEDFYQEFCQVEKISTDYFILLNDIASNQNDLIVHFDKRHLTQILWNLCKNAWQHSKQAKNSVQLSLKQKTATLLEIKVADDGAGIKAEDSTRLFEPFFTTKNTGNGLGLYISRELAQANGGRLEYLHSNQNTTFVLIIKKG